MNVIMENLPKRLRYAVDLFYFIYTEILASNFAV